MVQAPPNTAQILVIEDDPTVAEVVTRYLSREGYEVTLSSDGATGLQKALECLPDLVVLDLMLPGLSGIEVLRELRKRAPLPVVMLTALSSEVDKVKGLELGADDYVAKPFSPRELTARVKAVLRRASGQLEAQSGPTLLRAGHLEVDTTTHQVTLGGRLVDLTAREFDLLAHLMRHPMRAFRREELLERVWGFDSGDTSTVTVHVSRLREKVEEHPNDPRFVKTVRGVGYRFEP